MKQIDFFIDENLSLAKNIQLLLEKEDRPMTPSEISGFFLDKPATTIRGRIYDNLGKLFEKVGKGLYIATGSNGSKALLINGDGRNLSELPNSSVDAIITDHPWADSAAHKGGNRDFASYDCFKYTQEDFFEKARVLKEGGFLVENLPEESESNWEYLATIKGYAKKAGLNYYAQVPWKKGTFLANTGRKSKNSESLLFFTKGKARKLREDKQRGGLMSGATKMLPTEFNHQPPSKLTRLHQAEKPVSLLEEVIELITLPNEIILDQFAGSLNTARAGLKSLRNVICYENNKEDFKKMVYQLSLEKNIDVQIVENRNM